MGRNLFLKACRRPMGLDVCAGDQHLAGLAVLDRKGFEGRG